MAVAAVECLDAADAPMPRASARLRCPWAVAGPGHTTSRRAKPHVSTPASTGVEDTGGSGGSEGLAAVPVGGGGAWLGFEATRRAKLAARTTRGRAAAHGHIKQPGTHTAHTAHTARGPKRRSASGPHAHACQLTG